MIIQDTFRNVFGMVSVEVIAKRNSHPEVKISGVKGDLLSRDLQFYYHTSRVAKFLFTSLKSNSVTFPLFFAIEVLEIMERIIKAPRSNYTSRRTANQIKNALIEGTWLSRLEEEDYPKVLNLSKLSKFYFQPLPHQAVWLNRFDEIRYKFGLNGAILNSAPGSGKTISSLYVSECGDFDVTVVISPKNALDRVWSSTLNTAIKIQPTVWRSDKQTPYKGERYIVVHFEALANILSLVQDLAKQNKKMCIIVDESHNFNEMKSQRTQTLIQLCQISKSECIILQSGTPFKAIGSEIIPALFMIDPTFNDDLAERFKKLYAASATEALELLKRRLGYISHEVAKLELKLIPPTIINVGVKSVNGNKYTLESVSNEMSLFVKERVSYYNSRRTTDYRIYNEALSIFENSISKDKQEFSLFNQYKNDVVIIRKGDLRTAKDEIVRANSYENTKIIPSLSTEVARQFKEVKTIYKYVNLKIQGEALGQILGRRRMECSVEIARSFDYEKYIESTIKKTLVFTMFVQSLHAAKEAVIEKDYKPLVVYGETNKNLASIINDFDKNEEINPLIATFHSLSTAVPLTMASSLICLDVPWRDYQLQQAIARINRIGTDTATMIYICQLDTDGVPNLSSRTIDILAWSQTQVERITGTISPFVIDTKMVSAEGLALVKEQIQDRHYIELNIEKAFMSPLI